MKPLLILLAFTLLFAGASYFAPYDPAAQDRMSLDAAPSHAHWMGTDEYGRDQLSRFLIGGRSSLLTGAVAAALTLLIAVAVGGLAGFASGWADRLLMSLTELFLVVPWLYMLIVVRAALPLQLAPRTVMGTLVLLIALVSWGRPARLIRGFVLSLSGRAYVTAALAFDVPRWVVFRRHILPDVGGLLLVQALILFPRFVLAEVTLSYLGLGAGEPEPSWGALILPLKQVYLIQRHWWLLVPPALIALVFTFIAITSRRLEKQLALI